MQGRQAKDDDDYWASPGAWEKWTLEGVTCWMARPPCGHNNLLGPKPPAHGHEVDEHEDGMITVEPKPGNSNSILCGWPVDGGTCGWHGYIDHGVWRSI